MKRGFRLLTLGLFAAITVILNSCNKDLPSMSCKVGDNNWVSTFRLTTMGEVDVAGLSGILITATNTVSASEGEYFAILLRGNSEKEYNLAVTLTTGQLECATIYIPNAADTSATAKQYIGTAGTVTITEVDTDNKTISGTFSFTMKNSLLDTESIQITEGKFENLKYSEATKIVDLIGMFI